eukprot:scaffold2018_cov113-Cylindrotheca_fusiformis.AAC.2
MSDQDSSNEGPSKLERLRARVHSSRQSVVDKTKLLDLRGSFESSDGSLSFQSGETLPLHQQKHEKQGLIDKIREVEKHRESLQKDLKVVKQQLDERTQSIEEESQSALSTDHSFWEERARALESINEALKQQSEQDEKAKAQLSRLCETMEQKLGEKAISQGSYADESLAELCKELRDAQSVESSLRSELLSLKSRNDQGAIDAKKAQEKLLAQIDKHRKHIDDLSAGMAAIQTADGTDDSESSSSTNLEAKIEEFEMMVVTVKQRESNHGSSLAELRNEVAMISKEQLDFCNLGEVVVHKLQRKIKALRSVISSQMDFRHMLEARIQELQQKLSRLQGGGYPNSEKEMQGHGESLDDLSKQLAESNSKSLDLEKKVVSLQEEMTSAREEVGSSRRLLEEKEAALTKAIQRNEALSQKLESLEAEIRQLRDGAVATEDPAAEMELLMELQDVRQRMDQMSQESMHMKALLEDEQTRNSDLSQEIEELKATISNLESSNSRSMELSAVSEGLTLGQDDDGLLNTLRVFQVKIDNLIARAKSEAHDNGQMEDRDTSESLQVVTELLAIRLKVEALISSLQMEHEAISDTKPFSTQSSTCTRSTGELYVRLTNEMTGLSKDMVMTASPSLTLHEAVYNSNDVLLAKIREFPNEIAMASKEEPIEVQCIFLDRRGNSLKTFTGPEMRDYTTEDLSSLVTDRHALVKLVLRWHINHESDVERYKSVRVSNKVTGRMKEVIVPISEDNNLFDCVYNHDAIRGANIRKWPNAICEGVADKSLEIHCVLLSEGVIKETWSVDDLKEISSKQLVSLMPSAEDFIGLVLQCDKVVSDAPVVVSKDRAKLSLEQAQVGSDVFESLSYTRALVTNEATGRSQSVVFQVSKTVTLHEAMYENEAIKLAMVRRWPIDIVDKVESRAAEIKCSVVDDEGTTIYTYSIDELRDVSTEDLVASVSAPTVLYKFVLRCHPVEDAQLESTTTSPRDLEISESTLAESSEFQAEGIVPEESAGAKMQVQVFNETTERSKEIAVPISHDHNLFDAIYSNQHIREAKIRKWPTLIAQAVKRNESEVRIALLDGDSTVRIFSVEDLKLVSTKQLEGLVPKSDSVRVVLRCQKTPAEEIRELKAHVDALETEKQELEEAMETMKLEHAAKVAETETFAAQQRESVNSLTIELANMVANHSIAEVEFAEKEKHLETVLAEKIKSLEEANMKLVRLEGELKRSGLQNQSQASLAIPNLKLQISALERERTKLRKIIEENPLQEQLRELQVKLDNSVDREAALKEDLDAYKIRLHQELHGATASESSAKGELRTLRHRLHQELEAAKSREAQLMTEVVSYKDKLQQERYMLSCLSTELYESSYRESELRDALDHMEAMPKHDTVHTDETAVQIVDAEYAGEAQQDSLQAELDSARSMNEALSLQVEELERQVEKLERGHDSKDKDYKQLMERDEEMKASIKSLTSILEQTTDSNKALNTRVEELEAESGKLKKEKVEVFERAVAAEREGQEKLKLEADIAEVKRRLEFANEDNRRFSNLLEQKERMIADLQGGKENYFSQERNQEVLVLLEKSQQREKKLQLQYHVCVSELDKLTESSKAYQEATDAKLESTQNELDEQTYANELLKGVIAKLNQMNENLEEECSRQSKDIENLQSQNKEMAKTKVGDVQSINSHLTEEVTFLREQKTKFTKTVAKLQAQLQQMAKLKTEGDMERKRLESIVGELEIEKKHSTSLDDQLVAAEQKVLDLTKKLKHEREERAREAEEARLQGKRNTEEVQLMKIKVSELKQKLGDPLRAEKTDDLIDKVRAGEFMNKKLKKERNALKKELDDVNARMVQIKQEIGSLGF